MDDTKSIQFIYKNYRGEISQRKVIPVKIYYGKTDYHPDEQWLMEAYDCEKQQNRDFAMLDIIEFLKTTIH